MPINLFSPGNLDPYDSYGLISCQLATHLAGMGQYVNAIPLGRRVVEGQSLAMREIAEQAIHPTLGGILIGWPTTYSAHGPLTSVGPRIALTMFESTRIPAEWVDLLNALDAVIVPSLFCKTIFEECGIRIPIYVVPLGINDIYRPMPRRRKEGEPFTFLAFMDRGKRKGYIHAVRAYLMAFGDSPDVRLILKSRKPSVPMEMVNGNIETLQVDMNEAELYRLYLSADALLNPHKGEGFGLIPREFAASGGIALTTGWSGTADEIDQWGIPLPYRLVPARWDYAYLKGQELGEWAEPDEEGIAAILRDVYADREKRGAEAFERGKWAKGFYSWRRFAEGVYSVWKEVSNGN